MVCDCVSRRTKQLQCACIMLLLTGGFVYGIFELGNQYEEYINYNKYGIHRVLQNYMSPILGANRRIPTKHELLSALHNHINLTETSILRKSMKPFGVSPSGTLQIFLHKGNKTIMKFPRKSNYSKRSDGSPWLPNVETCAVLGNGGILKGSKCGHEIDAHDLVFRSNMAAIEGFKEDVGKKTNLMSINLEGSRTLVECYRQMNCRNTYMKYINTYLNDSIIWFSKLPNTEAKTKDYLNVVATLEKYHYGLTYAYPHISFAEPLRKFWNTSKSISSGLFLHAVAFPRCQKISMYGFYPFNRTESGRELLFHYYGNATFINTHNMSEEYERLHQMDRKGSIRLVRGNCS